MKDLYLDANAHVPLSIKGLKAYQEFLQSKAAHGHPSSPSVTGRAAAQALEEARAKIAELIGAKNPNQIAFTSSATQACSWGMQILYKNFQHVAVSPIEHNAVRDALSVFKKLNVNKDGFVIDDRFFESISCIYVQNEIGTIQQLDDLNCNFLFSDMCQALGKMPMNVSDLDVDLAAFGAHKFGGPSGVGFLYFKDINSWQEYSTGSRYFMDVPGTPNVAGIVATAAALEEAIETLPERYERMHEFRSILEPGLEELGFEIIGKSGKRIPNTTFIKVPCNGSSHNKKANCGLSLMLELGDVAVYGCHVGLGSACGSMYSGGSYTMNSIGRPSDGQEYIRISQWGNYGKEEANYVLTRIHNARKTYV